MTQPLPDAFEACSRHGDTPATVTFVNDAAEPADVYWVDYQCQPQHYRRLAVGERWRVSTYVSHAWAVVGAHSGHFLARAVAHEQHHTVSIVSRQRVHHAASTETFRVQPLYVLPSDGVDRYLDVNGTISVSVASWNGWFAGQAGGSRLRVAADVVYVRLRATAAEVRQDTRAIADALRDRGFDDPRAIYAVYYDGPNAICGDGSLLGGVATVYLHGDLCSGEVFTSSVAHPGYWEFVMLHEILHALGCVPPCAPHVPTERPAHVNDHPNDIMYYRPSTHPLVLDAGRDDYFGHGRDDCFDLARSPFLDPTPTPVDWPVRWQLARINTQRDALAGQFVLSTGRAGASMTCHVENASGRDAFLYFLTDRGQLLFYGYIAPTTTHRQQTYQGHVWGVVVVDADQTARLAQQWVAGPAHAEVVVVG